MEVINTNTEDHRKMKCDGNGKSWSRDELLGEGGYACVYKATSKGSMYPSEMAVKCADVSRAETLKRERTVMKRLEGCCSIIQCFGDELTRDFEGFIVYNLLLEYGSGKTLANKIDRTKGEGLLMSEVRWYTRSLLQGLEKIHKAGFVHCDLKPENILLFPNTNQKRPGFKFQAKICDFGLAKGAKEDRKKMKEFRSWNGTCGYIAPESEKLAAQECASDIWSLGIIVLEMLTGRLEEKRCPEIPEHLSPMAKSFICSCLTRIVKYRPTAKSLLRHPFIAGFEDA